MRFCERQKKEAEGRIQPLHTEMAESVVLLITQEVRVIWYEIEMRGLRVIGNPLPQIKKPSNLPSKFGSGGSVIEENQADRWSDGPMKLFSLHICKCANVKIEYMELGPHKRAVR